MESTKKVSSKQAALDMDARNKARTSSKKEGGILKRARWGATHRIHDHFVDGFPLLTESMPSRTTPAQGAEPRSKMRSISRRASPKSAMTRCIVTRLSQTIRSPARH